MWIHLNVPFSADPLQHIRIQRLRSTRPPSQVDSQAPLWALAHAEIRKLAAKRLANEDRTALRGALVAPLLAPPSPRSGTVAPNAN